jgi:hypothetical protein
MFLGLRSRIPPASRLAAWAWLLAATLVFKSFVPLLAATAAQMQGKAVADVCAVYGVRLATASAHDHHDSSHAMGHAEGHVHGGALPAGDTSPIRPHEPADHAAHAQDHCALTGLSACAVFAAPLLTLAGWLEPGQVLAAAVESSDLPRDAMARWLMLRLHAPPITV